KDGVVCDVYKFTEDDSKDLAIVRVEAGSATPLQKILLGDRTIEGYVSGKGVLTITRANGEKEVYQVGNDDMQEPFSKVLMIGDTMQWQADKIGELVFYEVCFPPYKDGRFEDIA
ncbi:MAG: hypothetical protein U1C52_01790, partial [Patescibacteria group bacterium]|nr:hypothetical protein [Patescibacteria group bacterium]